MNEEIYDAIGVLIDFAQASGDKEQLDAVEKAEAYLATLRF